MTVAAAADATLNWPEAITACTLFLSIAWIIVAFIRRRRP